MDNIRKIFDVLQNINKKNSSKLISSKILEEESDNINEIADINERLNSLLAILNQPHDKESLGNTLVELHFVLGDIEWQYDQLHDIVRQAVANLEEK